MHTSSVSLSVWLFSAPDLCPHAFVLHVRKSFHSTTCAACHQRIGGMLVKVMKCKLCKAKVHKGCFTSNDMVRSKKIGTFP